MIGKAQNQNRSRNKRRTLLTRVCRPFHTLLIVSLLTLAIFISWQPNLVAQEKESGRLKLSIRDASSGKATPARIVVADRLGRFYVAEDAVPVDLRTGNEDTPATGSSLQAVLDQLTTRVFNPYNLTDFWYSSGQSTVALPPGIYRLNAVKGLEFTVESRDVVIEAGQDTKLTIDMTRWINLPQQGWYSADAHVHLARATPKLNEVYTKQMQGEDLHVANGLQWGHSKYFHNAIQHAHGPEGLHQHGHTILASGQENPRTHMLGHTIVLGAKKPISFPDQYLIYRLVWEEAKRQGALSGYAHLGTGAANTGLSLDLPYKLLNFIEVIQLGKGNYSVWYDILNTGFRMTPIAGTDYPFGCSLIPGRERFYTKVEGPFTFDAWLDGVRRSQTFVTNGPMLEFRVAGKQMGQQITRDRPGSVLVEASVRFDPTRDDVQALEIIENGKVLRSFPRDSEKPEIHCRFQYEVREAGWLAVRSSGKKVNDLLPEVFQRNGKNPPRKIMRAPSMAHSSAIYISVKGAPSRAEHPRAKALAKKWIANLDMLQSRLESDNFDKLARWPAFYDGVEIDVLLKNRLALFKAIQAARQHFEEQAR